MRAKVRRMIKSDSIYIKKIVISGKVLAWILAYSSAVGSPSRRRMWGTWSRKNLMKTRLVCQSVRSVPWVVKKTSVQSGMMYDEHGVIIVKLRSSSLPEESERRISRGYCRGDRPRNTYLCIYWVRGPIQGQ